MRKKKIYKYSLDKLIFKQNKKYKLTSGNYGIKSITVGLINFNHLEVLRRKFSKQFKKLNKINKTKIFIRVCN
jgi:ribosomal protein L16/L10AE